MSELSSSELKDDQQSGLATLGVESFHRALQAALHARVALDLGRVARPKSDDESSARVELGQSPLRPKIPSGRLTLRKLHALQALTPASAPDQPGRAVEPSDILTAAFGDLAADLPQKYVNGFLVYQDTGRTDLVLDAMSVDLRAQRDLSRVARPSLAYLAALVLTGVLGSGALTLMLMVLDDLREDLVRVPHSLAVSSVVTSWMSESQFYLLLSIALLVGLLAAASLLTPVSAGIAKCLGGFGYLISQRRAMAARVEHALVLAGMEGDAAAQTANRLAGTQPRRPQTSRTVSPSSSSPGNLQRSNLEAKHYLARANTRLRQLRFGLPLLLVITIGSAGVLLYSLVLFVPLTNLLYELAAPIVDPAMRWGQR